MKGKLLMAGVGALAIFVSACNPDPGPRPGQQAHLAFDGSKHPLTNLGLAQSDMLAMATDEANNDTLGEQQLMATRFFRAPVGTLVLVLDVGYADTLSLRQVRVLEGQYTGQAGWVATTWLGP